jgi:hypothetical protein
MNNADSPTPANEPEQPNAQPLPPATETTDSKPRSLELGQIVATANAVSQLPNSAILIAIGRHCSGDWGDVCEEDRKANEFAFLNGERILSVYHTGTGVKFWIITEWDRSITTVLMPDDY